MALSHSIEPPLKNLFSLLNENQTSYCVLRSYDGLPFTLNGSDLDILVSDINNFVIDLNQIIKSLNAVTICQYWSYSSFYRICICGKQNDNWWGLQIDIHADETYGGLPYYDYRELLKRSTRLNAISVCFQPDSSILSLLKETLSNGKSKKDYAEKAQIAYKYEPIYYQSQLARFFGRRVAEQWDHLFRSTGATIALKKIAFNSRIALYFNTFRKMPYKAVVQIMQYQFSRWSRLFNPPGFSVAFIGPDGSGKTTVIDEIRSTFESALHSRLLNEHLRPNLLPSLASLFCKKETVGPIVEPHASKPSNFLGSLLRLFYYSIDYIFGYWFKVYPEMVKRPCLWIFDRYFHDYFFDSIRSRISLPSWIIGIFYRLIPKPDLVIFLGTSAALIHSRKPELPIEEISRQIHEQKYFCKKTPHAVWIDTGTDIMKTKENVLEAITTQMSLRYK